MSIETVQSELMKHWLIQIMDCLDCISALAPTITEKDAMLEKCNAFLQTESRLVSFAAQRAVDIILNQPTPVVEYVRSK